MILLCGRYYIPADEAFIQEIREILEEISMKYAGAPEREQMKSGEVFPSNIVPIVAATGAELATWGFPKTKGVGVVINARSESARTSFYWKDSVEERRVAIPTGGFFEWPHGANVPKQKYLFSLPGSAVLYLAGVFKFFETDKGLKRRVVILTTAANASVAPYHDRMPVLLMKDETEAWINDGRLTDAILTRVPPELTAVPVDPPPPIPDVEQMSMF